MEEVGGALIGPCQDAQRARRLARRGRRDGPGLALQEAYAEYQVLKPKYRKMRDEYEHSA